MREYQRPPDYAAQPGWAEPPLGNPMDSRWGGPTAWQDAVRQYATLGLPAGDRPFEGQGKFDITESIPLAPPAATSRMAVPHQFGPPQPGLFEALVGGLTGLATDFIPVVNEHNGLIKDVASFAGSILDLPFKFLPTLEFLPGGADIEGTFEALPDDDGKRAYEAYIARDPINAHKYMAEYLNSRGTEVAREMGTSAAFSQMVMPSETLSEQLRRMVFGALSLGSTAVTRTWAGSGRNVQADILDAADEDLPDELLDIKKRYAAGALTYDEVLDEVSIGRYRWTNDPSASGALLSFAMDVVTDPVTWFSLGVGGAAKSAASGAVRQAEVAIARAARAAGRETEALNWIRAQGLAGGDITRNVVAWANANAPDVVNAGKATLSGRQRALYDLEPLIAPAAKVANKIDNMFDWFGAGLIGRRLSSNITDNFARGVGHAYGVRTIKSVQDQFTDQAAFDDALGIFIANEKVGYHQQNIAGEVMAMDSDWRGAGVAPEQVVRARMGINDSIVADGEDFASRRRASFQRATATGPAATSEARQAAIDAMAPDFARLTGRSVDDARAFLMRGDDKTLSFVHAITYGRQVKDFLEGRREDLASLDSRISAARASGDTALADELVEHRANVERYTLIGDNHLTRDRAVLLEAAVSTVGDEAAQRAAIDAIDRFDVLHNNFKGSAFDMEHTRAWVHDFVRDLLNSDDGTKLAQIVPRSSLDPMTASRLSNRYEVALAPQNRWGITTGDDGSVKGVNTFVDVIDDYDPAMVTRAFNRRDVFREEWLEGIRGSRLYYSARDRFVSMGVRDYGLVKGDARRLFEALRAEGMRRNVGARGLKASDVSTIAHDLAVHIEPAVRARVGERGLLELLVKAWEGDLATVGLTSKVAGVAKSKFVQRTDNLLGRISEDLYVKARFALSPLFLAMELTEGPFFAILRGIKPGIKWTADDVRANSILVKMKGGERHTDQLERSQAAYMEGQSAIRITGGENGRFARMWNALLPERLRKQPSAVATRVRGLNEYKTLLYMRQGAKEAAEEFVENAKRYRPEALHQLEMTLGTSNPQKLWMRYMEDRGAFDQSSRHGLHMMDAAKPQGLGRREAIRMGDVAQYHGFATVSELRDAIKVGTYGRTEFIKHYTDLGLDPDYASRAYRIASGFSETEWREAIREAVGPGAAYSSTLNFHRWMARKSKMSFEEYMNQKYMHLPEVVASGRMVPTAAFRQSSETTMRILGMDHLVAGDPLFDAAKARSKELLAPPGVGRPTDLQGKPLKGEKRTHADEVIEAQRKVAETPEAFAPPPSSYTAPIGDTPALMDHFDRRQAAIEAIFENSDEVLQAANWYDEMMTVFLGLTSKMPDATIDRLLESWRKAAAGTLSRLEEEAVKPGSTIDIVRMRLILGDIAPTSMKATAEEVRTAARAELAARLNIAFAGSQMNTSVVEGMRRVMRMLDEAQTGIREPGMPYGFAVVETRLAELLRDFGSMPPGSLGPKLFDFIDNLAGKTTRSISELMGDTLQPAAMDIWMKRVWGYPDSAYLTHLMGEMARRKGYNLLDEGDRAKARADVLAERNWEKADIPDGTPAPTDEEYEYMLLLTNRFKDRLNDNRWMFEERGGRAWDAHEVQALMWVAEQRRLLYEETPPLTTVLQAGGQFAAETVAPGKGTDWMVERPAGGYRARYPNTEQLKQFYPDDYVQLEASISHDVFMATLEDISNETGVTFLATRDAAGLWVPPGGRPTQFNPNITVVMLGDEESMKHAARLIAVAHRQEAVFGITRPADVVLKATSTKPVVRSNFGKGRMWSLNIAFDPEAMPASVTPYLRPLTIYLEEGFRKGGNLNEVLGSMSRLMDDSSTALAFTWNSPANPKALARQKVHLDEVERLKAELGEPVKSPGTKAKKGKEQEFAQQRAEFDAYTERAKRLRPLIEEAQKRADDLDPGAVSEADFTEMFNLPPDIEAALLDGTWVHAFDPGHEPVPVRMERQQVQSFYLDGDHAAEVKASGRGTDTDAVVGRLSEKATLAADAAYARYAPRALSALRANNEFLDGVIDSLGGSYGGLDSGPLFQRGPAGAVRAGFLADAGDGRAATYFVRNSTDATTAIHEAFHLFARDLDPSARRAFFDGYKRAHPRSARVFDPNAPSLPRDIEEWVSYEFEKFVAGDLNVSSTYYTVFKGFAEWADKAGVAKGSAIADVFDAVLDRDRDIPGFFHDMDEQRLWESTRLAYLRAEETAHSTAFYRRSRNFVERSLNHPYLGMYPSSYMWGKVLPELTRFLVRRPFGLKAPLLGLSGAAHVWRNIQMQLETDEELRKYIDEHEETIRFLTLMVPGTPWELPVNLPLIMRRYQEQAAERELAIAQGREAEMGGFDPLAQVSDMLSYAVGVTQLGRRLGSMTEEWNTDANGESTIPPELRSMWPRM